jgi:K+-sensing histidine kinase KdpD
MVGWSVANGLARVAGQAGEDAVRLATTELPETRSEAAIPLRSRGLVIGAITVQSTLEGVFDAAAIAILQTMADLVSVAIDNARLYTETEAALVQSRRAYTELAREDWIESLQDRSIISYRSDRLGIAADTGHWTVEMDQAWQAGTTTPAPEVGKPINGRYPLAIPIKVRDNPIGVLQTHKSVEDGPWTPTEIELLESILDQVGVALDSARLYEETQIQATNERIIGEISSRMRESLEIDSVLKTAVQELRSALDLAVVEIHMGGLEESDTE